MACTEAALNNALALTPNHPWAHTWLGLVYIHTNRAAQAIAEAERALALDGNLTHAQAGMLAFAKTVIAVSRNPSSISRKASDSRRATAICISGQCWAVWPSFVWATTKLRYPAPIDRGEQNLSLAAIPYALCSG
jgi:hypothetical protein